MNEEITGELAKGKHNYKTIVINAVEIISESVKNWDFPGGAVDKTPHSQCRGPGSILVRELGPTCMLQLGVHMLQLRSPPAATR